MRASAEEPRALAPAWRARTSGRERGVQARTAGTRGEFVRRGASPRVNNRRARGKIRPRELVWAGSVARPQRGARSALGAALIAAAAPRLAGTMCASVTWTGRGDVDARAPRAGTRTPAACPPRRRRGGRRRVAPASDASDATPTRASPRRRRRGRALGAPPIREHRRATTPPRAAAPATPLHRRASAHHFLRGRELVPHATNRARAPACAISSRTAASAPASSRTSPTTGVGSPPFVVRFCQATRGASSWPSRTRRERCRWRRVAPGSPERAPSTLPPEAQWVAHDNAIFDVAWCRGDGRMLTASGDQTVRLWDVETMVVHRTFRGPPRVGEGRRRSTGGAAGTSSRAAAGTAPSRCGTRARAEEARAFEREPRRDGERRPPPAPGWSARGEPVSGPIGGEREHEGHSAGVAAAARTTRRRRQRAGAAARRPRAPETRHRVPPGTPRRARRRRRVRGPGGARHLSRVRARRAGVFFAGAADGRDRLRF